MPLSFSEAFEIEGLAQLQRLANMIASESSPGQLITLDGPLGSGKTAFTQALCRCLEINETVTSPSFGLANEYRSGKFPLAHLDLYRLGPEKAHQIWDELSLFLDEDTHLVLVEWAIYGERLPADLYALAYLSLVFEYHPDNQQARRCLITSFDRLALSRLKKAFEG